MQQHEMDTHLNNYCNLYAALGSARICDLRRFSPEKRLSIRQAENEFHRNSADALKLCFNQDLMGFLRWYFGDEPVLAMPQTDLHSRETPTHNDSVGMVVAPRGARVRMWVALEDIDPASGPLYLYARSHRLVAHTLEDEILRRRPEFLAILQGQTKPTTPDEFLRSFTPIGSYIKEMFNIRLQELDLKPQVLALQKGDVLVFDVDLLHGSTLYTDETLTRKHLLAYWDSASACYYLPRYYFGAFHDFRAPQTGLRFSIERTPYGYMHASVEREFEEFYKSYTLDISSIQAHSEYATQAQQPAS
jgi:Phytanoyl-CoA dioxygenase (PhyH)